MREAGEKKSKRYYYNNTTNDLLMMMMMMIIMMIFPGEAFGPGFSFGCPKGSGDWTCAVLGAGTLAVK